LSLHRLLQQSIVELCAESLCLELGFSDGAQLCLFSEIGPWECVVIQFTDDCAGATLVY